MAKQLGLHGLHSGVDAVEGALDIDHAAVAGKPGRSVGECQENVGAGLLNLGADRRAVLGERCPIDMRTGCRGLHEGAPLPPFGKAGHGLGEQAGDVTLVFWTGTRLARARCLRRNGHSDHNFAGGIRLRGQKTPETLA